MTVTRVIALNLVHLFYFVYVCFPLVVCGGTLNATTNSQTLTSPFFPNAYPSFTSCRWILDAPAQETIQLSVKTLILHSSQSCSANYLEIKDWPVVSSERNKLNKQTCTCIKCYIREYRYLRGMKYSCFIVSRIRPLTFFKCWEDIWPGFGFRLLPPCLFDGVWSGKNVAY